MKDGSKFARKGIMNMAPYIPGKPIEEVEREYGVVNAIKLASNENPKGTSPKALAAMQAELKNCYMYPEGSSPVLRQRLAQAFGIAENNILLANGGDHVIGLMCHAFINEGDEVIVGKPTFRTYGLNSDIMGGMLVEVPLDNDLTFDLDAMLGAITQKTKLIFLSNPNNPTGTIVRRDTVEAFMQKVPDHCIVVFDEAYCEYIDDPGYPNGIEYVKQERNVMVVRTFSKIYGLAGNRVGYAVAPIHLMDVLGRVVPAFPVNRVAQAAALAAFDDREFLAEVKRVNDEGRAYLCKEFDQMGMKYAPTFGNFIFVDTLMDVAKLDIELLKRGIIIRPGIQWGFYSHMRVTIGTMDENKKLIAAIKELKNIL